MTRRAPAAFASRTDFSSTGSGALKRTCGPGEELVRVSSVVRPMTAMGRPSFWSMVQGLRWGARSGSAEASMLADTTGKRAAAM